MFGTSELFVFQQKALTAADGLTFVLIDGTRALTGNWDAGSFKITAETLESDVTTGTAPLVIASTTVVGNLNADQVDGKDATDLVLVDGTQGLSADWDAGANQIRAETFQSDIASGTAPLVIASVTLVTNLNADMVDGKHASEFLEGNVHRLKERCRVATTANITLAGDQTIDGVDLNAADRVLVKDQTNKVENGIYVVDVGSAAAWTRATDLAAAASAAASFLFVTEGTTLADSGWLCTDNDASDVVATDQLNWARFDGGAGSSPPFEENDWLVQDLPSGSRARIELSTGLPSAADAVITPTAIGAAIAVQFDIYRTNVFTSAPVVTNDADEGYNPGSQIWDKTNFQFYICSDSTAAAAVWEKITAPFDDAIAVIHDTADATKLLRIDVGAITTSTTRVLTMPDRNVDLSAGSAFTQTYSTADATISAYTPDDESSSYTGIDNAQGGSVYGTVADLNALRVAYENLRAFNEDTTQALNALIDNLQSIGLVT